MSVKPSAFVNSFKNAIRSGPPQIGLWQALATPTTAEICAGAGFDWLLFDGEHGPNTVPLLMAQLQAVAPYPVHSIARPPIGETYLIKQYLDIGFQTLLVPFIENAAQAESVCKAMRYAPEGVRGIGASLARASRWDRIPDYLDRANDEMCLIVQIETAEGLTNLDAIARVDGVDALFIGPADLAASLGFRGYAAAPEMEAAISDAIARIIAAGKAAGTIALDPTVAKRRISQGCSFVAVGTDVTLLGDGAAQLARNWRHDTNTSATLRRGGY